VLEDWVAGVDLADPRTWVPFVQLFVSGTAPTGRAAEQGEEPSASDVMGNGSWELTSGASVTKFVTMDTALLLGASYGHRFARQVSPRGGSSRYDFSPGDELSFKLGFLQVEGLFLSWGASVSVRTTGNAERDGVEVLGSSTLRTRVGAQVGYYLAYPTWQLRVAPAVDLPVDDLGRNLPFVGPALAVVLQRNFPY